ncbi:MAG: hypothetical protein IPM16_06850 [Chloroflexi bacterium]|nr:hypothetical protein [Chloroflexota bacterium]
MSDILTDMRRAVQRDPRALMYSPPLRMDQVVTLLTIVDSLVSDKRRLAAICDKLSAQLAALTDAVDDIRERYPDAHFRTPEERAQDRFDDLTKWLQRTGIAMFWYRPASGGDVSVTCIGASGNRTDRSFAIEYLAEQPFNMLERDIAKMVEAANPDKLFSWESGRVMWKDRKEAIHE